MAGVEYLIVGNGVAGITAAQEIRHADPDGSILVVSDEGTPYYYRASLSEWISGKTSDEMLAGRTAAFYDHMRIEQRTGHVARVDPETRRAYLSDGGSVAYRRLLIATGARANVHPIAGLDPEHTLVYRSLADAHTIRQQMGQCGRALVVGGGILGLELVGALHTMKIRHIAIVQRSAPLGKPLLDPQSAAWLQRRMQADGIDLFINDTVERVENQTAYLKSGRSWAFDVLVQAVGVTPVFPEVSGLATGKGIGIDTHCRTNLTDVYAAGDCTETRAGRSAGSELSRTEQWRTTRIWLDCTTQGKIAGRNMAGRDDALSSLQRRHSDGAPSEQHLREDDATLPVRPYFNASIIYTVLYAYVGEPHGETGEVFVWKQDDGYRKLRTVDGRLAGALLLGQQQGSAAILKAIGRPVAQFDSGIVRPDFPWNELTGRDWDYLFY